MRISKKKLAKRLIILSILLIALIQVARYSFREEERRIRIQIRETVKEKFPEEVYELEVFYGLKPFAKANNETGYEEQGPEVILIHGLDDPGKVWMNLAPALYDEGYHVQIMTYPNDQPITDSAKLFMEQIEANYRSLKGNLSIVAHSMGGLVAREMLTNPEYAYSEKAAKGDIPPVKKLIMVGTPNHGSELAHLRFLSEFRDQLSSMIGEDYHWLQGIIDGAGEAGIDLIPGSRFLTRLNSRPNPTGVEMFVIAGSMSPWQEDDIVRFTNDLKIKLSEDGGRTIKKLEQILSSVREGLGDGLVSTYSAQLEGVPFTLVKGTHMSIIRNMNRDSQRIPPAVPVILEQLEQLIHDN